MKHNMKTRVLTLSILLLTSTGLVSAEPVKNGPAATIPIGLETDKSVKAQNQAQANIDAKNAIATAQEVTTAYQVNIDKFIAKKDFKFDELVIFGGVNYKASICKQGNMIYVLLSAPDQTITYPLEFIPFQGNRFYTDPISGGYTLNLKTSEINHIWPDSQGYDHVSFPSKTSWADFDNWKRNFEAMTTLLSSLTAQNTDKFQSSRLINIQSALQSTLNKATNRTIKNFNIDNVSKSVNVIKVVFPGILSSIQIDMNTHEVVSLGTPFQGGWQSPPTIFAKGHPEWAQHMKTAIEAIQVTLNKTTDMESARLLAKTIQYLNKISK